MRVVIVGEDCAGLRQAEQYETAVDAAPREREVVAQFEQDQADPRVDENCAASRM